MACNIFDGLSVILIMKHWLVLILIACSSALAAAQQAPLLLSELLFQPRSGEAEYIELYNHGDTPLQLANYHIVRVLHDSLATHYPLPTHTVMPHTYVAISKDIASVQACYHIQTGAVLIECNLPSYPNGGGSVVVATADSIVVDRLDYSPMMHSRLLRNKAGVALERRSFDRNTNDATNWFSASSLSGYGTPGYENSQSKEWLVEESAFEFSSTLLSPDGDDYQDELEIKYQMSDGSLSARIDIYNARGQHVRQLLNNALLGTHGTIIWNGTDENEKTVMPGQYIVDITVYDLSGTQQTIRRAVACLLSH